MDMKSPVIQNIVKKDTEKLAATLPGWLLTFMCVSISLVVVNRNVMTALPAPCFVLLFQNGLTVVINLLMVKAGMLKMNPWRLDEMKKFAVNACFMACSLFLNMVALPRVAIATLLVFKSFQSILSAWIETIMGTASFSNRAHLCLGLSFLGALLYSSNDQYYDVSAYSIMLLWVVVNVGGAIYDKKATIEVDQTPVGCSCYKNLLGLPLLLLFGLASGELEQGAIAAQSLTSMGWAQVIFSGFLGFGISLCYSSLNKITSATTITTANNFNKILTTILGSQIYSEKTTAGAGLGLFGSMSGIIMYGYVNSKQIVPIHTTLGIIAMMMGASIMLVMYS